MMSDTLTQLYISYYWYRAVAPIRIMVCFVDRQISIGLCAWPSPVKSPVKPYWGSTLWVSRKLKSYIPNGRRHLITFFFRGFDSYDDFSLKELIQMHLRSPWNTSSKIPTYYMFLLWNSFLPRLAKISISATWECSESRRMVVFFILSLSEVRAICSWGVSRHFIFRLRLLK